MESLESILNRLNITNIAENIDLSEFKTETLADMSVYQIQRNLKMDKTSATKLYREFDGYRSSRPKRSKIAASTKKDSEFLSKFKNLSNISYKHGDEWPMNICAAAFSASSKTFQTIFKMPGSSSQFGNPNTVQTHKGWTPLMLATAMGRGNIIDLMLREKVTNYLTQDCDGKSAMMVAASFGHVEIIKLLYDGFEKHCKLYPKHGIHPSDILNQQDFRGWSSLSYSVSHAQNDAVQILCNLGANPNLPDSAGNTPTLLACEEEIQESCLKFCLVSGGNLEQKNRQGKNGFEIANHRSSVLQMYQKYSKKCVNHSQSSLYGSF